MTYQPTHYDIWVTPTFTTQTGMRYQAEELAGDEFRFIADTLRQYFGDALVFEKRENKIVIGILSNAEMNLLRGINQDTCAYPVSYGRSHLTFAIGGYNYDEPPCDDTVSCDCRECYLERK